MRAPLILMIACGLAGCAPEVPDSGVGFENYSTYMRNRESQLAGQYPAPAAPAAAPVFSTEAIGSAISAAETGGTTGAVAGYPANDPYQSASTFPQAGAPLSGTRARGDAPAGIQTQSGEVAPNHVGISDENDFDAVAARETIQSDAERIAQNRAQYQVINPTALPERTGGEGPNIVQFALSTSHVPGTPMYKRSSLRLSNPGNACGRYGSPDLAQEAFLASGGPDRDRKGLDPDGDGYACGWDPRPFRN